MPMNNRLMRPMATGFNPRSIAGLGLWLDAADSSTLTLNGNTVSEWRDKSGNARHFSQGTAATQPNAVNRTQNGRRVLDFELSQELTGNAASLNILRNVSGATLMAAARFDALAATNAVTSGLFLISSGASTSAARTSIFSGAGAAGTIGVSGRRLDADTFGFARAASAVGEYIIAGTLDYANSDAFIYTNGQLLAQNLAFQTNGNTSDTDSRSFSVGSVGGGSYFDGWIGEILVWPRALSASERLAAERYLGRKWGITVA